MRVEEGSLARGSSVNRSRKPLSRRSAIRAKEREGGEEMKKIKVGGKNLLFSRGAREGGESEERKRKERRK